MQIKNAGILEVFSMKKLLFLVVSFCVCLMMGVTFTACKNEPSEIEHTHTYANEWTYDEEYHWHNATCEHSEEISNNAKHNFENNVCTICGYNCTTIIPSADEYSVIFDANNGAFSDGAIYEQVVEKNALLLAPTQPSRAGYVFVGWAKNANGTDVWDFNDNRVNGNLTLYAVWLQEITVTLDANGGYFSEQRTQLEVIIIEGERLSSIESPTRSGFNFTGWYTDSS